MNTFPFGKSGVLLMALLIAAPVVAITDEEYTTKIQEAIKKNLGEGNDKLANFACPAEDADPTKVTSCSVCIKGVNAANLDYTIEFRSAQEISKLVGSNVDIEDTDEDFDIKHYIAAFVSSCKFVLNNEQVKETILKKAKEVAEAIGLKLVEDPAQPLELTFLLKEGADKRSNNAVNMKIDVELLAVTFKNNFFENTFNFSMRHSLFVEAEIERALKQIKADLARMNTLLANEKEEKATAITLACETLVTAPYVAETLKARVEALTWTFTPGEKDIAIAAGEKTGTIVCEDSTVDGKVGVINLKMTYKDASGNDLTMTQAFLKTSMYDLNALVDAYLNDLVTFLIRFYAASNPEEKVDFGKKPLVEGGGEAPAEGGRRLTDAGSQISQKLADKPSAKVVKNNPTRKV